MNTKLSVIQTTELTGKIAHELSNIAAILRVNCDSLEIELNEKDYPTSKDLLKNRQERLEKTVSRLDKTVAKLKKCTSNLVDWHSENPEQKLCEFWDILSEPETPRTVDNF